MTTDTRLHPQLEILLQLQDLQSQRRELLEAEPARRVEVEEFHIDVDAAIAQLEAKIAEVRDSLAPNVRSRYERVASGHKRVVVPVIGGTCYGCFTMIATAATGAHRNDVIQSCENCGRFVYIID
jgi:predicted  nucleic acid-binding Zn-ribbon protein